MAAAEIRRQWRATGRAWRKLWRRRIKPTTALQVFLRTCLRTLQLASRLTVLLIGGAVVALLMLAVRLVSRLFRTIANRRQAT